MVTNMFFSVGAALALAANAVVQGVNVGVVASMLIAFCAIAVCLSIATSSPRRPESDRP
jgi:cytidine deaminase